MDETVISELCQALECSVSPNNEIRHQAERYVIDAMEMNGFCSAMLHIATNSGYNEGKQVDVTQAAAIQFK